MMADTGAAAATQGGQPVSRKKVSERSADRPGGGGGGLSTDMPTPD